MKRLLVSDVHHASGRAHVSAASVLCALAALLMVCLQACGGGNGSSPVSSSKAWPMLHQNRRHTGLSPKQTAADTGSQKWSFTAGDEIRSSPAIGTDGTIYVGSSDRKLYAINPDGSQKWSFTAGDAIVSSPAFREPHTFVGSDGATLYAMDSAMATRKWTFLPATCWPFRHRRSSRTARSISAPKTPTCTRSTPQASRNGRSRPAVRSNPHRLSARRHHLLRFPRLLAIRH